MSLFKNLLDTYEQCVDIVGIKAVDDTGNIDERKTLLPLFHTILPTQIHVVLDADGNLLNISRDSQDQYIIIPCTESSAGRTNGIVPHPLCEQLGYLDRKCNEEKFNSYLDLLKSWMEDNIKLNAIYNYIVQNRILDDLASQDLLKSNEKDENNDLVLEKIDKIGVRFSVETPGDTTPGVWNDVNIRKIWNGWLLSTAPKSTSESFDYLSGKPLIIEAANHPKSINTFSANSKLISCNDTSGLTFRGRLITPDEALQIDLVSTQKVHTLLKWLIANYSDRIDTQATLVWAVDKDVASIIKPFGSTGDIFRDFAVTKTNTDLLQDADLIIDANYSKKLSNILKGYGKIDSIKQHNNKIVVAIFDAATPGRMNVVFYQELSKDEYLESIANWHEDSSWHLVGFNKEKNDKGKEVTKPVSYIGCPSFYDITKAIYGKPKGGKDEGYVTIKKKVQKQLLECMFGNFAFPKNLVNAAVTRASNPAGFTDNDGKFAETDWQNSINITCALVKKYIKQHNKEDISMELEQTRQDRDYLYGRLLALAERVEKTALFKSGAEKSDSRTTGAMRLMSSFYVKPFTTWGILRHNLIPYVNQLHGAGYYMSLIDSVMVLFKEGDFESNQPLSPTYLLGYSAQRRALITKNEKPEEVEDDTAE